MWKTVRLGEIFDFKNGRSFKKEEWREVGLPIIRIQNLNDVAARFNYFDGAYDKAIEINKGDLLFSWSGTVGSSFGAHIWQGQKGVLNQHIYKLTERCEINFKYAFYCLQHITKLIEKNVVGAVGLVHVTKKTLLEFEIPLPPLAEQQRIVVKLDRAFAEIDKAIDTVKATQVQVESLELGVVKGTFSKFSTELEYMPLEELCTRITDGVHKKPVYQNSGIPFLKINNLTEGEGISFENVSYISEFDHEQFIKRTHPENGDILITKDGTIGVVRQIETDREFSIFVSLALIKPKDKKNSNYLTHVLRSAYCQNQLNPSGAALKHIYLKDLRKLVIPISSDAINDKIVDELDNLDEQARLLREVIKSKTHQLITLKSAILAQELQPLRREAA